MIITNTRYALVGYFITSYPTWAHGIIVIYLTASAYVGLCLCLSASENQPLQSKTLTDIVSKVMADVPSARNVELSSQLSEDEIESPSFET